MSRFQLLSDDQWALIADLMPGPTGKKGRPFADARTMVEGIIYRYRCGIAWRDLPEVFGPWQTVWQWAVSSFVDTLFVDQAATATRGSLPRSYSRRTSTGVR